MWPSTPRIVEEIFGWLTTLLLFGEEDAVAPSGACVRVAAQLRDESRPIRVKVYPGAVRPRASLSWPVTVNIGQRHLHLHTTNLSVLGAKVRSSEALEVGASAQLHFECPDGRPLDVQATVSRADADGFVFAFQSALDRVAQLSLRAEESRFRAD